jgi:hypothetical protein
MNTRSQTKCLGVVGAITLLAGAAWVALLGRAHNAYPREVIEVHWREPWPARVMVLAGIILLLVFVLLVVRTRTAKRALRKEKC